MKIETADIVISLNGRDAGKRFIVISTENGYSLIADGKGRRYEKPKRKKNKHLRFEDKADALMAGKLAVNGKVTNNEIRRFLAAYAAEHQEGNEPDRNYEGGMQECQKTT